MCWNCGKLRKEFSIVSIHVVVDCDGGGTRFHPLTAMARARAGGNFEWAFAFMIVIAPAASRQLCSEPKFARGNNTNRRLPPPPRLAAAMCRQLSPEDVTPHAASQL